jgi:hypothetical protein
MHAFCTALASAAVRGGPPGSRSRTTNSMVLCSCAPIRAAMLLGRALPDSPDTRNTV